MRFFKAFNILHRRTKSATFVPGPAAPELSFVSPTCPRGHGSLPLPPMGMGMNMNPSPSLPFDLATAKETSVPPNFNHLADRVSGLSLWRSPKRASRRSSTASAFDAMEKEHARLRDLNLFWVSENAKLQATLAQARGDLLDERRRVEALDRRVKADSRTIDTLKAKLAHYERMFDNDNNGTGSAPVSPTLPVFTSEHEHKREHTPVLLEHEYGTIRTSIDRYPPSTGTNPSSPSSPSPSSKLRSADEYASALRMTLTSRRQLREQKKITKFWKASALAKSSSINNGGSSTTTLMTPSVSTISSIQEQPLSSGRQDALKALILRRGQTLSLLPNLAASTSTSAAASKSGSGSGSVSASASGSVSVSGVIPSTSSSGSTIEHEHETSRSTLPSSSSNASNASNASNLSKASSRLSPLASESMKAEINLMFGSTTRPSYRDGRPMPSTPPPNPRKHTLLGYLRSSSDADTTQASASASTSTTSSLPIPKSLNIESFSDLNGFFNRTFGSPSRERLSANLETLTTELNAPGIGFDMTMTMTLPDGVLSGLSDVSEDETTTVLDTPSKKTSPTQPSLKQASKDCTPRRSWQSYISRAGSEKSAAKKDADKENLPVAAAQLVNVKSKQSRLPVPIFGRRD